MRKILETITLVCLGYMSVVTAYVLYGPDPPPDRIPIHFDMAGHPDGWGPTSGLAVLPFAAFVLYMLITMLAHYSTLAHYPDHATPAGRRRLELLSVGMIAWIKAEMVGIFVCIETTSIQAARHWDQAMSLVGVWILLGAVFVTIIGHFAAMVWALHSNQKPAGSEEILSEL